MPRFHNINGNRVQFTAQEETARDTEEAQWLIDKAAYDALQYQRDRATIAEKGGYPDVGDQLDMIYHDQVDGTTTFKDAIKAIKDAHPKP